MRRKALELGLVLVCGVTAGFAAGGCGEDSGAVDDGIKGVLNGSIDSPEQFVLEWLILQSPVRVTGKVLFGTDSFERDCRHSRFWRDQCISSGRGRLASKPGQLPPPLY